MDDKKTVFITGSSRGIGKAIAQIYGLKGYNVILNCKTSTDKMNETINQLKLYNENITGFVGDVGDYKTAKEIFDKIYAQFNGIDILINNAGISYIGTFNTMEPEQWQNLISSNLNSVINCSHLALKYMLKEHKGCIVNISSMWGVVGASCEVVYSATKGAVNTFTRALAKEVAPNGIRVNALSCGVIDTEMNSFLTEDEKQTLTDEIPLCRFGTAEEVAKTVFFLTSDKASYVTGQILGVDGGMI